VTIPFLQGGKQQRDPKTGALLYVNSTSVAVEFDTNCDYTWGVGTGTTNASSNLLNNCYGALTTKDAWLFKKYHASGCSAVVSGGPPCLGLITQCCKQSGM
jgi:hypothetical protein